MRKRPTELRAVAELLQHPAEDATELAELIIDKLDELRQDRDIYAVWMYDPNARQLFAYGPYPTAHQGRKALERLVSAGPETSKGMVIKLHDIPDLV